MAAIANLLVRGARRPRESGVQELRLPGTRALVRARWILLVLVLSVVLVGTQSQPARVSVRLLLLAPHLMRDPLLDPLVWVSQAPRLEQLEYVSRAGAVQSDLYLPTSRGTHPAIVISSGVFTGRREPDLVRFADGLARSGVVVMVPESATLRDGDIVVDEVDTLRIAVELLRNRPEVDASRVGLFGFSVGGALALLAAADEPLRDKVSFVHVSGAYFDTRELLREVATRQIDLHGQVAPWTSQHVTEYTLHRQLVSALPAGRDRDLLWRAMLDGEELSAAELGELSSEGTLVLELNEAPTRERVDQIIEALPISSRQRLDAISPNHGIGGLRARLYVLHGRSDDVIAFTQSRQLAAHAPGATLRCYTESSLFEHVSPDTQPSVVTFARELPGLAHHAWLVGSELL